MPLKMTRSKVAEVWSSESTQRSTAGEAHGLPMPAHDAARHRARQRSSGEERRRETVRTALSYCARVNSRIVPLLLLLVASCHASTGPGGLVRSGTPDEVNIVRARERGLTQAF